MAIKVFFNDAERSDLFGVIFQNGVPVKSPVPTVCDLGDIGQHECYMLDLDQLEPDQLPRLAAALAQKFQKDVDTVTTDLVIFGVPIRAEQTTLTMDGAHLGLLMVDAAVHDELHSFEEIFGSADDDFEDFDDDDFAEDDPIHCPQCGEWLDFDGCCMDMECGWSFAADDFNADEYRSIDAYVANYTDPKPPADNVNEIPF